MRRPAGDDSGITLGVFGDHEGKVSSKVYINEAHKIMIMKAFVTSTLQFEKEQNVYQKPHFPARSGGL